MTQDIEQRLKQDATTIQAQAASRLSQLDFSLNIEQRLHKKANKQRPWLYGLAAAVCLTVISWMVLQNHQPTQQAVAPEKLISQQPPSFNLKQIPLTVEDKVNQPLKQEQQAIIEDLKRLRSQLISI